MLTKEILDASKDSVFMGAYREWVGSPVTRKILGLARDALDERRLGSTRAEDALYHTGVTEGGREVLAFLTGFSAQTEAAEKKRREVDSLKATYGVKPPEQRSQ